MRHVISVLLQNEVGALTRITGLFATRGYNIESLNVAPTDVPLVSRLTMVVHGSDEVIGQINNQMGKLVDVVNIHDMTLGEHFEREILILKMKLRGGGIARVQRLAKRYGAEVLDKATDSFTVQLVASPSEIDNYVAAAASIAELSAVARSGSVAVSKGVISLSSYQSTQRLTG